MLRKKLTVAFIVVMAALFVGTVHAGKPDEHTKGNKSAHKESSNSKRHEKSEKKQRKRSDDADHKSTKKDKNRAGERENHREFNDDERSEIVNYYRDESEHRGKGNKKHMPYGLQKKLDRGGKLPPGWETKVARGEVLDDEILRHSEELPDALVRRLPEVRDGTKVRRVGNKVVRVLDGTGTVVDVIDLIDEVVR